jgi:D-xylose transport system ATP-binding protein
MSLSKPVLEVRDAVKRYGAVLALDHVSLSLGQGEVLALLGDNGAGKSTLIRSISGAQSLDEGAILVGGESTRIKSPIDARGHGIETVYQDLALFDNLNVVANFFAGRERMVPPRWPLIGWLRSGTMSREAGKTLDQLQVNLPDLRSPIGLLSGGQRQAVAVARAVHFARSVVILDEPTAALGIRESRNVLEMIRRLPAHGVSVILISHNLEQVMEVADRAIVLRRGRMIGEAVPSKENHDRIVGMIVGSHSAESGLV